MQYLQKEDILWKAPFQQKKRRDFSPEVKTQEMFMMSTRPATHYFSETGYNAQC